MYMGGGEGGGRRNPSLTSSFGIYSSCCLLDVVLCHCVADELKFFYLKSGDFGDESLFSFFVFFSREYRGSKIWDLSESPQRIPFDGLFRYCRQKKNRRGKRDAYKTRRTVGKLRVIFHRA